MSAGNGKVNGFRPLAPFWAVEAGLPEPEPDETFEQYVERLGLRSGPLVEGLTERTMCLANVRLSSELAKHLPDAWDRHLTNWVANIRRATL